MNDQRKTKAELIDELVTLRQRVASPEASGADGSHRDQVKPLSGEQFWIHFMNLPTPAYVWCRQEDDFTLLRCNKVADRVDGRADRSIGKTASEIYADMPEVPQDMARCCTERKPLRKEMEYRFRSTGKVRQLDVTYVYVPPDLVVVHTDDITDTKQAEDELRQAKERFMRVFHSIPVALGITALEDGTYRDVNKRFLQLFGYRRDEVIGRTSREIGVWVDPKERDAVVRQLRHESFVDDFQTRLRTKAGDVRDVLATMRVFDMDGEEHVLGSLVDITKRKQAEESLRESEERYQTLVEHSPDATVVHIDGKLVLANPAAARLLGAASAEDLIGEPVQRFVHPDYRELVAERTRSITEGGSVSPFMEEKIVRLDGRSVDADIVGIPVMYGGEQAIQSVLRDMTARKEAEEALHDSRDRLRNLAARLQAAREEERTSIAREMHDELGQALTGMQMELHGLIDKLPKNRKALRERAGSLVSLVDSTIETVRAMSWRLRPPILDDLGLEAAIEWHAEEFTSHSGLAVRLDLNLAERPLDTDCTTTVFRILQEALTNVARHAEASNVEIALTESKDVLVLDVRDDGKGIAKRDVTRATALGLIGMRERAGTLGGRVVIRRTDQGGTQVKLTLPLEMKEG